MKPLRDWFVLVCNGIHRSKVRIWWDPALSNSKLGVKLLLELWFKSLFSCKHNFKIPLTNLFSCMKEAISKDVSYTLENALRFIQRIPAFEILIFFKILRIVRLTFIFLESLDPYLFLFSVLGNNIMTGRPVVEVSDWRAVSIKTAGTIAEFTFSDFAKR